MLSEHLILLEELLYLGVGNVNEEAGLAGVATTTALNKPDEARRQALIVTPQRAAGVILQ